MGGISKPIFDDNGVCIYDSKIGICPFIDEVANQRISNTTKKGAL